MTPEQQELLCIALVARDSGFKRVEIAPEDLIALLHRVRDLEREIAGLRDRAESLRRRYEPTMAEWSEDADAQAGACWG